MYRHGGRKVDQPWEDRSVSSDSLEGIRAETAESQRDWRERANDDLALALAISAWQVERHPIL